MKMNWIILSLLGLLSLSVMSFLITYLTRKGYPTSFVLLGIGVVFVVLYSLQTFAFSEYKPTLTVGVTLLILFIGVLSTVGNFLLFQAANQAPNPGLAIALGSGLQAGVVALLAFFFLKDKLSVLQILGLILAMVSVFLIILGEEKKNHDKVSKNDAKTSTSAVE